MEEGDVPTNRRQVIAQTLVQYPPIGILVCRLQAQHVVARAVGLGYGCGYTQHFESPMSSHHQRSIPLVFPKIRVSTGSQGVRTQLRGHESGRAEQMHPMGHFMGRQVRRRRRRAHSLDHTYAELCCSTVMGLGQFRRHPTDPRSPAQSLSYRVTQACQGSYAIPEYSSPRMRLPVLGLSSVALQ
jgi:hypothetical protein